MEKLQQWLLGKNCNAPICGNMHAPNWEDVIFPNFVVTGQKLGTNFVFGTKNQFIHGFVKKLINFRKINEVIQQKLRSC